MKELALYVQDTITTGNWSFNLGMRGDMYNGLTTRNKRSLASASPTTSSRATRFFAFPMRGPSKLPSTKTWCFRASAAALACAWIRFLLCSSQFADTPLSPGFRNEFHAGLQQAFGKHMVFDGEYIWKYTHNGYDFSVLGNTPITFPIEWAQLEDSRIHGARERARTSTASRRMW